MLIEDFKLKCAELFEARAEHKDLKEQAATQWAHVKKLEAYILEYMNKAELQNFDTGFGKVSITHKSSAKCVDKRLLHEYLKASGVFNDLVSVNSRTLNGFHKEELQKAIDSGASDFNMPGIESTIIESISIRGMKK